MWKPLLLTALAATAACDMEGDRALDGGECPDTETCSNDTPSGLSFDGPALAGDLLSGDTPIAVGGTEDITLVDESTGRPLGLAYTVDDEGSDAIRVTGTTGPVLHLAGDAAGGNLVRILDNDTGTLFDRKTIQAQAVGSVGLVSTELDVIPEGLPVAILQGARVGIGLFGAGTNDRLVDGGMTMSLAGASRVAFDTLGFAGVDLGPATIAVALSDGTPFSIATTVVDHVETVEASPTQGNGHPAGTSVPRGQLTVVCFTPKTGGAYVLGTTFAFATDNGTVDPTGFLVPNCTGITPATIGTAHISATAGGASITIALPVVDAAARTSTLRAASPTRGTPDGDRAKLR